MNEWMWHKQKKRSLVQRALSFIPFNMLLISSMIVTKAQTNHLCVCVCVCVCEMKEEELWWPGGPLSGVWACQYSFLYCIQGGFSNTTIHEWHCLFSILNFLRAPCQGKSEHLLLFIPSKDTNLHATHCSLPWTTLFISCSLIDLYTWMRRGGC